MVTTLNEMLFKVKSMPIADRLKVNSISSTQFGIFGWIDGPKKRPTLLNVCSEIYELVENDKIFPAIEEILRTAGIEFDVTYKMIDFSRFYADYTLKVGGVSVGNGNDKIFPVIRVTHSYNGLLKYKITFGWFRLICTNGLVVPVEGKEEQNISIVGKHTKQILQSLSTLLDKVKQFTKNTDKYSEKFEVLADRSVKKWEDRIIEVMAASGVGKRGFTQIAERVNLESDKLYDGKVNDWLLYNGFNYHIFNAVTKEGKPYDTAPNLRHDQDRKVFDTLFKNKGVALTKLVDEKFADEREALVKVIYGSEDE
jgi:hypothetical protein